MKPKFDWALERPEIASVPNLVLLRDKPERWDEYLDLPDSLVIGSTCQDWQTLGQDLWRSGLSPQTPLFLLSPSGEAERLAITELGLGAKPQASEWVLLVARTSQRLQGRHYIVTRAAGQATELISRLRTQGAMVRHIPCLEFVEPDSPETVAEAMRGIDDFDLVLFTSKNAVRFFVAKLGDRNLKAKLACIGPGTAKSLRNAGLECGLVAEKSVAEGLLDMLQQHYGGQLQGLKILLPRAQVAREVLPERLRELGAEVTITPVYKTVSPPPKEGLEPFHPETRIVFSSASTVQNWDTVVGANRLACYCLGPVTRDAAEKAGFEVLATAKPYTIEGLMDCILANDAVKSEKPP